jgi:hypothetical protein
MKADPIFLEKWGLNVTILLRCFWYNLKNSVYEKTDIPGVDLNDGKRTAEVIPSRSPADVD